MDERRPGVAGGAWSVRIVAKLLEDFNGDWHWVDLHDAELIDPAQRVYQISGADTVCGIRLSGPNTTRLHDTGAPPEPDCPACLEGGALDPSEMVRLAEELAVAAPVPVPVRRAAPRSV